jgi:hypothetical protein
MTTGLECLSMLSANSVGVLGVEVRLVVRGASGFLWVRVPIFPGVCGGRLRGEGGECWRYGKLLGEIMVGKSPCERFPVTNDAPSPSTARRL